MKNEFNNITKFTRKCTQLGFDMFDNKVMTKYLWFVHPSHKESDFFEMIKTLDEACIKSMYIDSKDGNKPTNGKNLPRTNEMKT